MSSTQRARVERALLIAQVNLQRALQECESYIELEESQQLLLEATLAVGVVVDRVVAKDKAFLRTRPFERSIEQRHHAGT